MRHSLSRTRKVHWGMGVGVRALVLGPIEVWVGDRQVSLGGPKPRTLLAALLLQPRQVVPVERLIDLHLG